MRLPSRRTGLGLKGEGLVVGLMLITFSMLLFQSAFAGDQDYVHDLEQWQEATVPPASRSGERMAWFFAANYSNSEWRVYLEEGKPSASYSRIPSNNRPERPDFVPKANQFHGGGRCTKVEDGWLVGFNQGEFGAALYWFSNDGTRNYKVSDHQVVNFVTLPDGVYAVEGLAHMGISRGSIIRIARNKASDRWEATTVADLPFAPYAVVLRRDGTMLITLSGALVSFGSDQKVHMLLSDAPWGGLYPNSSLLSPDEQRLYIGMRQFVGEFDLKTNQMRLLIPSIEFLNRLPKDDEERIRKQYGG